VEAFIEHAFRFVFYAMAGMVMETIFAMDGIERALGCKIHRRVPRKYLEGFVSLYMVPLHGGVMLAGFEWLHALTREAHWGLRFLMWSVVISLAEAAWGWILDKTLGFYPWNYYADSRFKVFRRGYTLWTLVPMWGVAGLVLEHYSDLMIHLSPHVSRFFLAG
jgi:hypothetical protein